jgi:hypothetical protein
MALLFSLYGPIRVTPIPMKPIIATILVFTTTALPWQLSAQNAEQPGNGPTTPPPSVAPLASEAPAPSQVVYVPQLPTAQELTNAASAQGVEVIAIADDRSQVTVTYKLKNGQTNTVGYQLLPAAQAGANQTVVLPTTPAPAVVYQTAAAPRVVYYTRPSYYPDYVYYPSRYWYSPVSLSLGIGLGYYGGYYGGYRGRVGGYYGGHGHGGHWGGGHGHYRHR